VRHLLWLVLLGGLIPAALGQTWVSRYNGPGNDEDRASAIAADGTGSVYVTGTSWGAGMSFDLLTIKYGSAGESLWAMRYDGAAQSADEGKAIAVSGSRVAVAGSVTAANFMTDMVTIAYGADGSEDWVATLDGPSSSNDAALAVVVDGSGNVIAAGYETNDTLNWDLCVAKYNSTGSRQWVGSYSTIEFDYAVAVATDASGDVYVGGNSGSPYTFRWDFVTAKLSSATGETLWVRRLDGPLNDDDEVKAMTLDRDGNVYVTGGMTNSGTSVDFTTVKYSSNGELRWVASYNGPANGVDWANAIAVDFSGNVYVTGYSQDTANDFDYATVKYNPGGGQEWVARYDGPGHGFDEARAIAVTSDGGRVVVTGTSTGDGTRSDYATVIYDGSGNQSNVYRYDGPLSRLDEAAAIVLDGIGGVCVTGGSEGSGTLTDYATLRYPGLGIEEGGGAVAAGGGDCLAVSPSLCRDAVRLSFRLNRAGGVRLSVRDAAGRTVAVLASGECAAGRHAVELRPAELGLGRGVYFACVKSGGSESSTRFVVVR
jgi:hypothetical protein